MNRGSDTVERFISELEKLGATGKLLKTYADVVKHISGLVVEKGAKLVLMGDLERRLSSELSKAIASIGASCFDIKDVDRRELRKLLEKADIGITGADLAVAETGSLVIASENDAERLLSCLPPIHIAIISKENIIDNFLELAEWLRRMQNTGTRTISIITGPSRTADIELEIVMGVHGPCEQHVIILEGDVE
ncbi:MAG: lactate utilization protein [Thaumarchaeota archaeon]|jgi:L-lactate dehydrogenase complex protein LldG|nr:lactate utilization protein [Candidatus Terraquivivens yellowstonensis]